MVDESNNTASSSGGTKTTTTTTTPTSSSSSDHHHGEEEEEEEAIVAAAARELRAALEELFEHRRFCSLTKEEQLSEFVLVISQYQHQPKVLQRAVLMVHSDTSSSSYSGRLPIHLACDKSAPMEVIRYLLEADNNKKSITVPDRWGDLPLHTACSRTNVDVVRLLLEADDSQRTTIHTTDHQGSLPLHMACRYNAPAQIIQLLLESDDDDASSNSSRNNNNNTKRSSSLLQEGIYKQLPLHIACRCGAPPDVIELLLRYDLHKESVQRRDSVGRLPIHLALLRSPNINVIELLLRGMICHRMEQLGLEQWKHCIQQNFLISILETPERDFMARERLNLIADAIRDLRERVFLLELICWKVSCRLGEREAAAAAIKQGPTTTANTAVSDIDPSCNNSCEYRRERRIKSGAEIIIPSVLRYIEDEPIAKVIREIG